MTMPLSPFTGPLPARAVIYRRVSTDRQGFSLDAQDGKGRSYVDHKGLEFAGEFADEDVSGGSDFEDRPGGRRLLALVRERAGTAEAIGHLVVAKLDRLARNAKLLLDLVDELAQLGVCVHFIDMGGESFSTGGPLGRFFITMLAAFAEFELATIRERAATTTAKRRADGLVRGGSVKFGERVVTAEGSPARLVENGLGEHRDKKTGAVEIRQRWRWPAGCRVVPDEAELAILAEMKTLHGQGRNPNQIAVWLNGRGIPTKTGVLWQTGNVKAVLGLPRRPRAAKK